MRSVLLAVAASLILVASAAGMKLETNATVALIAPAEAGLASWDDDAAPTWSLAGTPGDQIQVSLELRTADGRRLVAGPERPVSLDHHGQLLTTLPTPDRDPHAALTVLTLVVCHE